MYAWPGVCWSVAAESLAIFAWVSSRDTAMARIYHAAVGLELRMLDCIIRAGTVVDGAGRDIESVTLPGEAGTQE